jgi:N-acetylglucosaminyl-diphospho-decaprenol L-rhamnosyltransferase
MLSIIIVNFNTKELTINCIHSVFKETLISPFEIIIFDNASVDGSALAIHQEFGDRVHLITSRTNLGFAGGNNAAAQYATGEYILLLNPDTVVLDGAIDKLTVFAVSTPDAGIWGGKTLFGDMSLNPASCWMQQTTWSLISQMFGFSSLFRKSTLFNPEGIGSWNREGVRKVDIVSGCFLLIDQDLWEKLNGFHPDFFMYGEEADLCLRAKKIGFQPIVTSHATIIHFGGASEKVHTEKMIRLFRAKELLIKRHWKPILVGVGLKMLRFSVLTRVVAYNLICLAGQNKFHQNFENWKEIWQRRSEWKIC